MSFRRNSIKSAASLQNEQIGKSHRPQEDNATSINIDKVDADSHDELYEYCISSELFKSRIRISLIEDMEASGGNTNCLYNIENGTILAEHIAEKYRNFNTNEKNLAFLWSCFVKRDDLLEPLYRIGADLLSTFPGEGLTALHLAAFSGCVASCDWLIWNGLDLNLVVKKLSPIHCAVLGNSLDCTKLLLKHGAALAYTVIKFSIITNATECVQYLLWTYYFERFENQFCGKLFRSRIRLSIIKDMKAWGGSVNSLYDIENGKILAEQVAEECRSLNFIQKNLVFLWSCFVSRSNLLEPVYRTGADMLSTIPSKGFTALHLAAFSGCVKSCQWLILNGLKLNLVVNDLSPLHCAVLGKSLDCMKLLIRHGAKLSNTVLHCVVKANAPECIQYLLHENAGINAVDEKGWTAFHVAADLGMAKCLQIMISHRPKADLNIQAGRRKSAPLHFASRNGYFECCQLLIDGGADPNAVNHEGQTALHVAALVKSTDCLEILLDAGCNIDAQDEKGSTPLHEALSGPNILAAHDALKVLLKRGADMNVGNWFGYTPLHEAARWHALLSGTSQCVDLLIMSGADLTALTNDGLSALSIINQYCPGSIKTICRKLDSSVSISDYGNSDNGVELILDFRYFLQNSSAGEMGFLKTLESEEQEYLVEHPTCKAFLHLKWQKIWKFYFCHLFFYLFFVILLTAYVIYALAHECYNAAILAETCPDCLRNPNFLNRDPKNISTDALKICLNNFTVENNVADKLSIEAQQITTKVSIIGLFLISRPRFIESTWCLLVVLAVFEGARKIMNIRLHGSTKHHFCHFMNFSEYFVILSVFLVSHVPYGQTFECQKIIGGLAVLFAWISFMTMVGQLPIFGIYIAMFTKVKTEFFKLLIAYSCLLIGFTACFSVVFPSNGSFQNPLIGFIKILVMMTGELDFEILEKNLEPNTSSILNFSAYIIYTLFIIFVAVVLMNLLVGIAVHDIKGLHKTAGLSKLVHRIRLIYFFELAIRRSYLPKDIVELILDLMSLKNPDLCVKPFDPHEKRLPKEVMMAAFSLAKQKKTWTNSACCWSDMLRNCFDSISDQDDNNSYEELRQLKEKVQAQNALISKLVDNEGNCYSKNKFVEAEKNLYEELRQLKETNRAQNVLISELVNNNRKNSHEVSFIGTENLYEELRQLKEMNRAQNSLVSELVNNNRKYSNEDRIIEVEKNLHEELQQLKEVIRVKNRNDSQSSK